MLLREDAGWMVQMVTKVLGALETQDRQKLEKWLLPADHALVRQHQENLRMRDERRRNNVVDPLPSKVGPKFASLSLTKKQQERLQAVLRGKANGHSDFATDVSQSEDRAPTGFELCPCICPGSVIVLSRPGRLLTPEEKLLMHGVPLLPVQDMANFSQAQIASLGGNTMHTAAVATATLCALALVKVAALDSTGAACEMPAVRIRQRWIYGNGPLAHKGAKSAKQTPRKRAMKTSAKRAMKEKQKRAKIVEPRRAMKANANLKRG